MKITFPIIGSLLFIALALACNFPTASAQVDDIYIANDYEGVQATTAFSTNNPFYLIVHLSDAKDDTRVKAVWSAQGVQDFPPGFMIGETELISGNGVYHFELENEGPWPVGRYKVDLYINEVPNRTLEFEVR
jgi:hypothetical protein